MQVTPSPIVHARGHERGIVAAETDMNIRVADDDIRRYLADIQFTSWERLDRHGFSAETEIQDSALDLAIEIVSPSQNRAYFEEKVRALLISGATIVLVVDTGREEIIIHRNGSARVLSRGEQFEAPEFPGLSIGVTALFDSLIRR